MTALSTVLSLWLLVAASPAQAAAPSSIYVRENAPEYRTEFSTGGRCFRSSSNVSEGSCSGDGGTLVCKFGDKSDFRFRDSSGRDCGGEFPCVSPIPYKADARGRFRVDGVPVGTVRVNVPYAVYDVERICSQTAVVAEGKTTEVRLLETPEKAATADEPAPATARRRPSVALPAISYTDDKGKLCTVEECDLPDFERELRERFARKDAPDELLALATTEVLAIAELHGQPRELLEIAIYGGEADLRWFVHGTKAYWFERSLSAADVDSIRKFIAAEKVDDLRGFSDRQCVGGTAHRYLHLTARTGRRVDMANPPDSPPSAEDLKRFPRGDPAWKYADLVALFDKFKDPEKVRVHYAFTSRPPEFEVLYAHPIKAINAVWEQGRDLCVAVSTYGCTDTEFRVFAGGRFGREVPDPKLDEQGCSSPDGRWTADVRSQDDRLVCFDNVKKEYVRIEDRVTRTTYHPLHYIEAHHAFLLVRFEVNPWLKEFYPCDYRMLDPATGKSFQVEHDWNGSAWKADVWFQRLPRRLQPVTGRPGVVWAARPASSAEPYSRVGHYDTKSLCGLGCRLIPYFDLQTKDIWVDEDGGKIYAICDGHLLAFPLDKRRIDAESDAIIAADKAAAAQSKGMAALRAKDFDKAIAAFSEAIRIEPKDPETFRDRARAYAEKGDLDKAIADHTEVIRLEPCPKAYWSRGDIYVQKGDYGNAIADYTQVIRLAPDSPIGFWYRGGAYLKKRDFDKAIAEYTEAIRVKPKLSSSYQLRGAAYAEKGDFNRAVADYTEAIRLRPENGDALLARARAYTTRGEFDKAVDDFVAVCHCQPALITDDVLRQFKRLSGLRSLDLSETAVTDAGLAELSGLVQLQSLYLGDTKLTDAGLKRLRGLKQLQTLRLAHTAVTDAGLLHLQGLAQLRSLDLAKTKVTGAGLQSLQHLSQLERLDLTETKVGDDGLANLKGLARLRSLDLEGTKITDAGLERIQGLKQLRRLNLSRTNVTDAGLEHLKPLGQLAELRLSSTKVTDAGVRRLTTALPRLRVRGASDDEDPFADPASDGEDPFAR
jgi:tetratricopeptide (TPR) repeat protein